MTKSKSQATPKTKGKGQDRPKKTSVQAKAGPDTNADHDIPIELQQLLLNIFQNAFPVPEDRPLKDILQEVKGHLYNRDFVAAFGKDEYLYAYAIRWSASRSLGYLRLLNALFKEYFDTQNPGPDDPNPTIKVTCIGGGAGAELVSLAGILDLRSKLDDLAKPSFSVNATLVDMANWGNVITRLHWGSFSAPPVSAYASAAVKASNVPLLTSQSLGAEFLQHDVLALADNDLERVISDKHLLTIFFTLNELYTTSIPKTQAFLLQLTQLAERGTLLLVVDSAGSYSAVSLNGQEKKYPMHWLLDHALLSSISSSKDEVVKWEKLQEKESEWFRMPEGLRYPIELENMRYQLHLYRRL